VRRGHRRGAARGASSTPLLGRKALPPFYTSSLTSPHPKLLLTNNWFCSTLRYVRIGKRPKPFPSYHIAASRALSCGYTLFCATAIRYLFCSQWLAHSLYRHGGGTPRSPSDDQGIQGSIFSALCFHSLTDPCRKLFAFTSGGVAPKPSLQGALS